MTFTPFLPTRSIYSVSIPAGRSDLHRRQDAIPHTLHSWEERPLKPCRNNSVQNTNLYKTADTSPHAVIRQLPPSPGMCNVALVEHSTQEINENGDYANDEKDCAWANALFNGRGCETSDRRENFEGVGALIGGNANVSY